MCGRFNLRTPTGELIDWFDVDEVVDLVPRYNIAPTQNVAVVRQAADGEKRQLAMLEWGLVPPWAADPSIGHKLINARSETAASKPAFRSAFRRRRCLIPADGFYEWQKRGRQKQPFLIRRRDGRPFAMAGLWEHWQDEATGARKDTCTVLTTDANETVRALHDRMPVILDPDDYAVWLDRKLEAPERLTPLLRPMGDDELEAIAVSPLVNNPRNEDPRCIEPVPQQRTLGF